MNPTKLSASDSAVFVESVFNSDEPNSLLKALFSKDNEELLETLLSQKRSKSG